MKGLSGIMVCGIVLSCAVAALWLTGPAYAEEQAPKPGATFKDCVQCPEMVAIPGGTFLMGSPAGEKERNKFEGPQHRVTVRQFAMGKYEVTFAQWDACVAAGRCNRPLSDMGWGRGNRPVIFVSWRDTKQYVAWLSRKTGKRYRLPSESEWEYAARAGTRTRYWWGDAIGRGNANCRGCGSRWDKRFMTAPVGSFRANRFGLHDILNNVWEWVEDCRHVSYTGAPSDGRAWTTGDNCIYRVTRGGAWNNNPNLLRAASRYWQDAGSRFNMLGFRVARTLP